MRQLIELQPIVRRPGHLAALTAMGLAVGLIIAPLDAAQRVDMALHGTSDRYRICQ